MNFFYARKMRRANITMNDANQIFASHLIIFEPSNGGIGSMLNTASHMLTVMPKEEMVLIIPLGMITPII